MSHFPSVLVARPSEWVVQGCSSAGFSSPEPSQSNPAEPPMHRGCSLWDLQLQHQCKHQSHWSGFIGKNCTRTTQPPEGYLSSAFPAAEDSKGHIFFSDPPLEGWWLKLANFMLRLGSFPNMDKSLEKKNQTIQAVNNKAQPSTFLPVHMWIGRGCSEIKPLKKKKKSMLVPDNKPIYL